MSTISVDDVCPESYVLKKISAQKLQAAKPIATDRDVIRATAYDDVLKELATRTPPVYEADLADPTELQDAIAYRMCHLVCRDARGTMGDTWDALAGDYAKEYRTAVSRNFTVSSNQSGPSGMTFALERR